MFDRKKFKKAQVEEIDKSLSKAQETMVKAGTQGGRASFLTISKEGRYEIRILPSVTAKPYIPRKCVKLPIECPVYKDGKDTGRKELRSKDVFTSDIHSERMEGKDAIVIYTEFVERLASEIQDQDERRKFLSPITGFRKKDGDWVWGIRPLMTYVSYVLYEGEIYRFDIRPQWWKEMKSISVERSKKTITLDVFSDDERGYPLIITCSKDPKTGKMEYSVSCGLPEEGQSWDEFFEANQVPDSVLESLSELPTLDDLYVDVFSRRDWDFQLEGLKRIDEQYGFNIFEDDEFLDRLEALEALVPEDEDVKKSKTSNKVVSEEPEEVEEEEAEEVPAKKTYPTLIKMKTELKKYIEVEYEGTETLPNLSVVELRKWYDLMKQEKPLPFENSAEPDEEEEIPAEEEPSPVNRRASTSVPSSIQSKLAKLRAKK